MFAANFMELTMTWIAFVPFEEAAGRLKDLYEKYKRPNDTVANIISAHSIKPHMLEGHMAFYRAVLGHSANEMPLWFHEAVGVYVSTLNKCAYCIDHHSHFGGLAYPGETEEWNTMAKALAAGRPGDAFDGKFLALLDYSRILTVEPASLKEEDFLTLREAGASDGEILEVNQVAGYFAYANRTVLGLGVTLDGEVYAS